jgi:hypothetical protein
MENDGTVLLVNGTHNASPQVFSGNDFTLTCTGSSVVIVIPTYTGGVGIWFSVGTSNVTISNLVLRHTYSYSGWSSQYSNSPLMQVEYLGNIVISNVTIIPNNQTVTYANPFVLGYSESSFVNVSYSSFSNFSLTRVSLFYDYSKVKFYITNVTFRYEC